MIRKKLDFSIYSQPDNTTCGPTCLHAVYNYLGENVDLRDITNEIVQFDQGGGTLNVILGIHALKRGFEVTLYSYNLNIFDPTWFELSKEKLIKKLYAQLTFKNRNKKFRIATKNYIHFLKLGGKLLFHELTPQLLRKYIVKKIPILTGLSSTYLYQCKREHPITNKNDDLRGRPAGHFVVLYGHDLKSKKIFVADPFQANPVSRQHYYQVEIDRLIASIHLGILTYDGDLLIIWPKKM